MKTILLSYSLLILLSFTFSLKAQDLNWEGEKQAKDDIVIMNNPQNGLWKDQIKLKMVEMLSIGIENGDENYILVRPIDISVDKHKNIYICDFFDHCVKVFTQEGKFLHRIGQEGQGPQDLMKPFSIVVTDDDILVVIDTNRRISFFSTSGEFITCYSNFNNLKNLAYAAGDSNIFVSRNFGFFPDENMLYNFFEFSIKGDIINKIGNPEIMHSTQYVKLYSTGQIAASHDGKIFEAFHYPYKVRVYNKKMNHEMTITRECKLFSETNKQKLWKYEILTSRAELIGETLFFPTGNFIVTIQDKGPDYIEKEKDRFKKFMNGEFDTDFRYIYDLFDSEGHFLQSFYWDENGERIINIDQNGYAYTISGFNDTPKVKKYHISFVKD